MELMTPQEVTDRLAKGQNPLDLSIEKWLRLEKALEEGIRINEDDMGAGTCALCQTTPPGGPDGCDGCSYYKYYGHSCEGPGAHFIVAWNKYNAIEWHDDTFRSEVKVAFRQMTQALKAIKKARIT